MYLAKVANTYDSFKFEVSDLWLGSLVRFLLSCRTAADNFARVGAIILQLERAGLAFAIVELFKHLMRPSVLGVYLLQLLFLLSQDGLYLLGPGRKETSATGWLP